MRRLIFSILASILVICAVYYIRAGHPSSPPKVTNNDKNTPDQTPPLSVNPHPQSEPSPTSQITTQSPKFATMRSTDRNTFLQALQNQDFSIILTAWQDAGRVDKDLMKQGAISTILGVAMRDRIPPRTFLNSISEFILSNLNSNYERSQLLGVLSQAATEESLDLLLQIAPKLSDVELKQTLNRSISVVGNPWGDGTYHEELSPLLENAWRESQDPDFLGSLGIAIAEVGSSNGMRLLIQAAIESAPRDHVKTVEARAALNRATILNPNAVNVLGEILAQVPIGSDTSNIVGQTLAGSGAKNAASALLTWLRNADERAAPFAKNYIGQVSNSRGIHVWESALDPSVSFRSEKNREAVRLALATYNEGHKLE